MKILAKIDHNQTGVSDVNDWLRSQCRDHGAELVETARIETWLRHKTYTVDKDELDLFQLHYPELYDVFFEVLDDSD